MPGCEQVGHAAPGLGVDPDGGRGKVWSMHRQPKHPLHWIILLSTLGTIPAGKAWAAGTGTVQPQDDGDQAEVMLIQRGWDADRRLSVEIRFATPVVAYELVGVSGVEAPLVFEPPLAGRFRWLSRRSGLFVSAPGLTPGGEWRVRLKEPAPSGLHWPAGARLERTIWLPGLEVVVGPTPGTRWEQQRQDLVNARPTFRVSFSQPVRTESVRQTVKFRSTAGRLVPAEVTVPGASKEEALPESARLFDLKPWSPLPPTAEGEIWELEIGKTVQAVDPAWRMEEAQRVRLGPVPPLKLTGHRVLRDFNQPPCIDLRFNHWMAAPEGRQETATDWFRIEPGAGPLSVQWRQEGCRICLPEESIQPHRKYRLWISGALAARDGSVLGEPIELEAAFPAYRPRLMAPGFVASQQALGQPTYRLLALNVSQLRLRSKRLDRPSLVHALRGFGSYLRRPDWIARLPQGGTARTAVDYNVVPGRTVLDRSVAVPAAQPDQLAAVNLPWEELLGGDQFGVVFLEAAAEERPDVCVQTILQRTDLGLLWKSWNRSNLVAQVFSLRTGRPLEGVQVQVVGAEDQLRSEGVTDASGSVRLSWREDDDWLVARRESDMCAFKVTDRTARLRVGRGIQEEVWSDPTELLGFMDRNLYRPGETAHLKVIARRWEQGELKPPAGEPCELQAYGPGWKRLWKTNLVFGPLGSADWDWVLPESPRGDYWLLLRHGRRWRTLRLTVADFQPAGFELEIQAPKMLFPGQPLEATVRARYLFGAPVAGGRLRWWLESSPAPTARSGWADWSIGAGGRDTSELQEALDATIHEDAERMAEGWRIRYQPPAALFGHQPRRLVLVVSLTDPAGQTLQERTVTTLYPGRCQPGIRSPSDVVHAGTPVTLPLAVFNWDGQPWPDPLQATVRVDRIDWETVRYQSVQGRPACRSEKRLHPVLAESIRIEPMGRFGLTPEPTTRWTFTPPEAGQYRLRLECLDPEDRLVRTESFLWAGGPARLAWDFHDAPLLELVPDRAEYEPGQTARLLVKTPFGGQALVSVERDAVLRQFVTQLEGNAPIIELPIQPGDGPNLFVAVTLLRGAAESPREHPMPDYRHGVCALRVREPGRRLGLALRLDPPEARPREPVHVLVEATGAAGNPVAGAELTLFAVDEGVLRLGGYSTPDPAAVFLDNRPLGVRSFLSLFNLLDENPDYWTYPNKGTVIGGGGRSSGWILRQHFAATPLWIAATTTDAAGRAAAVFQAPDNLTQFRVIAVAHTADGRFGLVTQGWQVRQPLMVTPATPAFARTGDRLLARVLVHNQTGQPRHVRARLALGDGPGRWIAAEDAGRQEAVREFALAANARRAVQIPVLLERPGRAQWVWQVEAMPIGDAESAPVERDAVQVELEVAWPTPLRTQTLYAVLEGGETNLLAEADPSLLEGEGRIQVRITDSAGLELEECFRQLLQYPYGCVEQTSSSLIPWILLHREPELARRLGRSPEEAVRALADGWRRLQRMQRPDGSMAYWPGASETSEWGSAYAALVMTLARQAGANPPSRLQEPLLEWVDRRLGETLSGDDTPLPSPLMAGMGVWALRQAGRPVDHHVQRLFARRFELSPEDNWLLAAALGSKPVPDPRSRFFLTAATETRPQQDPLGSPRRAEAIELLARTYEAPHDAATHTLARRLLEGRRAGHWGTTQANAWAAWALAEYLAAATPHTHSPLAGQITGPDQAHAFTLTKEKPPFAVGWPLSVGAAPEGIRLVGADAGPLFVETRIESHAQHPLEAPLNQGLALERHYQKIDNLGRLLPAEHLRVGDPVLVTLRLSLDRPVHYLALVDALPAVLEPVHLAGQGREKQIEQPAPDPTGEAASPRPMPVSFREIAGDQVQFFSDYLPAGRWQVRYLSRVRCGGRTIAPSARAEAMYDPERRGYTAARWFEVEEQP